MKPARQRAGRTSRASEAPRRRKYTAPVSSERGKCKKHPVLLIVFVAKFAYYGDMPKRPAKPPAIDDLLDELKARDRRIAELRDEVDEGRELLTRMREQVEDCNQMIERWCEAFGLQLTDDGKWTNKPWIEEAIKWGEDYHKLQKNWNRFVGDYNAVVAVRHRNVGRPLAASDAQCNQVRKLRKAGRSLRNIAEETSLGLRTVCTIVAKGDGTDRTTVKHLQRIDPDRAAILHEKSQARAIRALPGTINATLEAGRELLKEAKGRK